MFRGLFPSFGLCSSEDFDFQVDGHLKGEIGDKGVLELSQIEKKPYWGNHFWARGYFLSIIGLDEEMISKNVRHQQKEERRVEDQQQWFDL